MGFVLKKIDYTGPLFGPGNPFDSTSGDMGGDLEIDGDSDVCSYGGGMIPYCTPQFWLIIAQNVSVFLAFSGLLNFYHAVAEDLSWCRPFPKFLCIKGELEMSPTFIVSSSPSNKSLCPFFLIRCRLYDLLAKLRYHPSCRVD